MDTMPSLVEIFFRFVKVTFVVAWADWLPTMRKIAAIAKTFFINFSPLLV
jgi:hypothetical protein